MKKLGNIHKKKMIENIIKTIFSVIGVILCLNNVAYASSTDPVAGINSLARWFLSLVQAVGAIFVIKNGYEFYVAYQQDDNSSMSRAIKGLIGGVGMVCLKFLLQLLGVSI